ncbi:COX15/CtaA family protein [Alicyclobacillus shizuokensis]|uniref:COX15/CtaA family protein n=1 Tax=Alicyclobacillus shizuokensis TaxID=392014 RepID=UPI0008335EA7|nr:COX15/CtaA family protein [Alicyclobacillus shizuokensis]
MAVTFGSAGAKPGRRAGDAQKRLWQLSLATFLCVFLVNTLGFLDTVTGSALGCGRNWPLCNGQLVPSRWSSAVVIEYSHRLAVLLDMVLFVWLAVALLRYARKNRTLMLCLGLLCAGIVLEAVLGALAVLFVNPSAIMAAHVTIAILSFVGTFLLVIFLWPGAAKSRFGPRPSPAAITAHPAAASVQSLQPRVARWSAGAVLYVYIALYIGAYAANTGWGAAFKGWPIPLESPALSGGVFWLDVLHRSVALGMLILAGYLWRLTRPLKEWRPELHTASRWFLVLVLLQAVSGGILIAAHIAPWAFLLHVTVVSFLFATVCYLALAARRKGASRG